MGSNGKSQGMETDSRTSFDITVLVLTYQPSEAALRKTLLSAVRQKGVSVEIVVSDDGSRDNLFGMIEQLFRAEGFTHYQLLEHRENRGTIANYLAGLEAARGMYTKSISPGDFLTGPDVLAQWLDVMRREDWGWSFSDAIYYEIRGEEMCLLPTPPFPVYRRPYLKGDTLRQRWNYTVLDDAALGATMMGKTELKKMYAQELLGTGNKYVEDYIFRLMMFDGVPCGYYPRETVFYEHGTGISSGKSKEWNERIAAEFFRMNELLLSRTCHDAFQEKMLRQLRKKTSFPAMMRIPGKLRRYLLFQMIRRKPVMHPEETLAWRTSCR